MRFTRIAARYLIRRNLFECNICQPRTHKLIGGASNLDLSPSEYGPNSGLAEAVMTSYINWKINVSFNSSGKSRCKVIARAKSKILCIKSRYIEILYRESTVLQGDVENNPLLLLTSCPKPFESFRQASQEAHWMHILLSHSSVILNIVLFYEIVDCQVYVIQVEDVLESPLPICQGEICGVTKGCEQCYDFLSKSWLTVLKKLRRGLRCPK